MKISVKSQNQTNVIEADGFDNLLSALRFYGYKINASCDGLGKCGSCKVIADGNVVTACNTLPYDGMTVELFSNNFSEEFFDGNATVESASAVIDIGTTTVCGASVHDGKIISSLTEKNAQESFGSDVISRIAHADGNDLALMHKAVISQTNSILNKLSENTKITDVSIVGNTAMLHIFLNIPCKSMGVYPYTPHFLDSKTFDSAKEVSLDFSVPLRILPSISAFCGADILADIADAYREDNNYTLLIDFGTNAEIALFNKDKILVTSAAAGPAFEGGRISCGMPALDGAIYSYELKNSVPIINTVNKKNPVGICGSGLIDIMAELLRNNFTDKTGLLKNNFEVCKNIFITQADVREFQLAKAAVEAAVKILVQKIDMPITRLCICGSFGKHLNIENAKFLRLIPDSISYIEILENAPVSGVAKFNLKLQKKISETASYIDISANENFEKTFESCLNFSE